MVERQRKSWQQQERSDWSQTRDLSWFLSEDFSAETLEARCQWNDTFTELKEKKTITPKFYFWQFSLKMRNKVNTVLKTTSEWIYYHYNCPARNLSPSSWNKMKI